jgi:hypothetical protein
MVGDILLIRGESDPDGGAVGSYNLRTKQLMIITRFWPINAIDMENEIHTILLSNNKIHNKLDKLKNNDLWNKLFSIRYPASTVIHELEHARRKLSGHGAYIGTLYKGDQKIERNFEEAANNVFEKIITGNFYQKLVDEYRK